MISVETIKISLFASRVKTSWPRIKNNHKDIIDLFYKDFKDIFFNLDSEIIIQNFIYNASIGVIGIIIFDQMIDIFLEHKLMIKSDNSYISKEISIYMLDNKFYKELEDSDLVLILNPLLKAKNIIYINRILEILKSRKRWKTNCILLEFYNKVLREMRLIFNSRSILYIPSSGIFNNFLSRLSLRFSSTKFVNRSELLFHSMYNSIFSCLNNKDLRITLEYSSGINSGILLYLLWLARQNKRIHSLHVAYIKNSSRKLSESFIIRLCKENQIPLRIRTITEKGIISSCKQDYLRQTKIDILLDLGHPIITAYEWDRKEFIHPLKYFSQADKLYFVKNYKIPYYRMKEYIN